MNETKTEALASILAAAIPGLQWDTHDDLCDCTFQRIGFWTNPYIGATLRMRLCCLWKELAKQYPDLIQEVSAFYNYNTHEYEAKPWEWNGEFDMPRAIWYRHLASKTGAPLAEVRQEYADQEPPKGVLRKQVKPRRTWRLR
jgi:hypothetical protein